MKINKPKFWETKNIISLTLLPVATLLQLLIGLKKIFIKPIKFKIPIICIGNIYLGGTGKTPLCIWLIAKFEKDGKNPALIKKYYLNHIDEHNLIKNKTKNLYLNKKRSKAIFDAEKLGHDLAILDDGFQDKSIAQDLKILCFNSKQLIGNSMTIPSGPLRESFKSIKNSDIIIINGKKNEIFEEKIKKISNKIEIFYSKYIPINIDEFKKKKNLAFAGIGNPK
jgi:Tetraacyldisaccharide-1-P 4''-kinase